METTQTEIHSTFKKALDWKKEYYFDRKAARRVVEFFSRHVRHTKGSFAGKQFILEPWQRKITRRLFGWKRKSDGTRKYRTLFVFVPRKNGKSTWGAGIALYLLHGDGEIGAEIVSAAADTDQANVIFSVAKDMNDADLVLRSRAKSYRRSLVNHSMGSSYIVISADAHTKHGKNLHGILFDELHTQHDRELYDVLKTSTGARRQPLEIYMTTAGFDRLSICYEVYDYAKRVAAGDVDDPSFYPVIYEATLPKNAKDDPEWWTREAVWKEANPNFEVSVFKQYFEKEVREARAKPASENTFKRLHLNIWTESNIRAINMGRWRQCGDFPLVEEEYAGQNCILGLDLSSTQDLTSLALIFKRSDGKWAAIMRFWCPEKTIPELPARDRILYQSWIKSGHLLVTPGGSVDYKRIRAEINYLYTVYCIKEIAADPWNAIQTLRELEEEDGFTVVQIRQGMYSLNAPTKELIRSIDELEFVHGNNPILTWNAGNLETEEDASGNLKPAKKSHSREKIDGCVAVITGLARALVALNHDSVYSGRGVVSL